MSRSFILGFALAIFAAVLIVLTALYQAFLHQRAQRRAAAARRLGIERDAPALQLERPTRPGSGSRLAHWLEQAGAARSPRAFWLETVALATAGLLVSSFLLHGPARLVGLVLGAIPYVVVRRRGALRTAKITEQLPDCFDRIAGTLRAGHALSDALRIASEEMPAPLSEELTRVVSAQSLGVDLRRALQAFADRNRANFDIRLFVGAVLLNRETGGNLVEILGHLAETVRERLVFDGKVAALTAEVRLSAWILGALPFAVTAVLLLIKPTYLTPLLVSDPGRMLVAFGVLALACGALIMRRVASVEV